ncbi:MAG: holo-ACP synthase [Trueperaceae bacterium]|nr:MAG: holo-ACP synthase [Trueperaceae bacterium]
MILAVGLDIIELARVKRVWQRHPQRFLDRHFTAHEISFCQDRSNPVASLAARFAAKEAFQKCWHETHGWRDVWVVREGAKPRLAFATRIQQQLDEQSCTVHLSLTHSKEHAAAVVVLEKRGNGKVMCPG